MKKANKAQFKGVGKKTEKKILTGFIGNKKSGSNKLVTGKSSNAVVKSKSTTISKQNLVAKQQSVKVNITKKNKYDSTKFSGGGGIF